MILLTYVRGEVDEASDVGVFISVRCTVMVSDIVCRASGSCCCRRPVAYFLPCLEGELVKSHASSITLMQSEHVRVCISYVYTCICFPLRGVDLDVNLYKQERK